MKYNTMKQYLGGGYMRPMGYQTGGYIPGISRLRYGIGLNTKIDKAQEDLREQAEKVQKEQEKRSKFSRFGKTVFGNLGEGVGTIFGLGDEGKALGSLIGSYGGQKIAGSMYDAGDIKQSSTGLFDDDFEYLKEIEEADEKDVFKKTLSETAGDYIGGKASSFGAEKIGSAIGNLFSKQDVSGAGSLNLDVINPEGATPQLFGGKGLTPSSQGFQAPSIDTSSFTPSNIESTFAQDQLDPMSILEQAGYPTQTPDLARQYYMEDRLGYGVGNQGLNFAGMMEGGMMRNYAEGGQLKQAPEGNKGLMKLPKEVRNRMGYMQEGGEVSKLSRLLSMISPQGRRQTAYEEMSPEDMMGDALTADSIVNQPMPEFNYEGGVSSKRDIPIPPQVQDFIDVGLPDSEGGMMSLQEMLADPENLPRYMQGYGQGGMMNNYMGGGMMDNYMYGGMAKKKKEYAGGGLLGMMPFKRRIV